MSTLEQIKKLREMTGAGIVEVKKALEENDGNEEKAIETLRKSGQAKALKKADRCASEGIVGMYVHSNQKMAAMVKILCETDFVARNADFQAFAQDIAMHITATNPQCVRPEDVDADFVAKEKEIWTEQLKNEGKPEDIMKKIMEGKEQKLRAESALLSQPFVKDPDKTVEDLMNELVAKIGEKIEIGEFARFSF
ncbi:MAG TPA: translation elongation factor Ts [Candidatus Pacebacteria bacterium]|nr:translation elongation factor Ts [Candidatus Paceibacterota bacterium]